MNSPVQDRIDTPFGRASHQYVVVGGEDVVPQEEVVDTGRKGMYLSVVSTPQHPVDLVPRQKLVNKALVHQTILDLHLSEIKGDLPLGGRTRFFRHNWEKITPDFQVLEAITGYKLDLIANPVQHKWPHVPNFSAAERVQIDVEIADMLNKEAIEITQNSRKQFLSHIFLRLKKYIRCEHFKMEGMPMLADIIRRGDHMCKDAYFCIPVAKEHRRLLRFSWKNQLYQFKVLAFGLGSAPRIFTKILKIVTVPCGCWST